MKTDLERDDFLVLLEKLKSEDDKEILSAARDINAKMTVAGVSWNDLLISQDEAIENIDASHDNDHGNQNDENEHTDDNFEALNDEESQEAISLIKTIENMKVSETTKQELSEYKDDLKEGEFEKMDLRYLRALKARLSD